MGEPLANYERHAGRRYDRLNDPEGFGLGARHVTISTAGWVPGIRGWPKSAFRWAWPCRSTRRTTPLATG